MSLLKNVPLVGKIYNVSHSRKGQFQMFIKSINGEWVKGTITAGKADALCDYNERSKGEEIEIRESLCQFTLAKF